MNHGKPQPLVSVIVPVYNVERYLACCLDSIVNQTYEHLEIILINDGSTDNSEEICLQYAERDARVRLFTQENQGQSAARNVGLDHMRGEYIVFVDSDDYISPYLVECLLNGILEYGTLITVCDYFNVEDGDDHAVFDAVPAHAESHFKRMSRDDVFDTIDKDGCMNFGGPCCKLYHKKIFESLRYPEGKRYEDTFLFCELFSQVDELYHIGLALYAYRQSADSTTRREGRFCAHPDLIEAKLEQLAFFQQYGVEKYVLCIKEQIGRCLTQFDNFKSMQSRKYLDYVESEVYCITGKRISGCRYAMFKVCPNLYCILRICYCTIRARLLRWAKGNQS